MNRQQQTILVSTIPLILLIIGIICCISLNYIFASEKNSKISFKINDWSNFGKNKFSLINIGRAVNTENGKIAPGSQGEFDIKIDARGSEKELKYNVKIKEFGNKPENLLFSLKKNGELINKYYRNLSELAEKELSGSINNNVEIFTIVWCWKFETGENLEIITIADESDTLVCSGKILGKEEIYNYSFSLKLICT